MGLDKNISDEEKRIVKLSEIPEGMGCDVIGVIYNVRHK